MHSIDNLAVMFRSLSIDQQSFDMDAEDNCYEKIYDEGYEEGYAAGYAAAYAEIMSAQSRPFTISQNFSRNQKPPFGWKVMQNQMVQNPEEKK